MPQMSARFLANDSKFEPQRRGHFEVQIEGFPGGDMLTLITQSIFVPGVENEVVELQYMNEKVRYAGNVTFNGGEITVRDFVDKDTYKMIMEWRKQVYDPDTGEIHWTGSYKKQGYVILTDPEGRVERKWRLINVWPSSVATGSLEHGQSDIQTIAVTLTFDKAIYEG